MSGQRPRDRQFSDEDEAKECEALGRIVFAFRCYGADTEAEITRWQANYARLPPRHRALLSASQPAKLAAARAAARTNRQLVDAMLAAFDEDNEEAAAPPHLTGAGAEAERIARESPAGCPPGDTEKVRYVLKNLARDWSAEGAAERAQSYGRICDELARLFPDRRSAAAAAPRVLIPGAGLGRLMLDVAALGLEAQGNEFSYFMLMGCSFMLNHAACRDQWTVHPWLHSNLNHLTDADQLRPVTVPDVHPGEAVGPGLLSMCAGDFVDVYSAPEMAQSFDAVATCFFIDTAHNVIEYLEVIHHVLKPGGYWIHLGPLLWHWADSGPGEASLELPLAEVHRVARLMGFETLRQEFVDAAYIANQRAMYKTVYQAAFWTMRRGQGGLPQDLGELLAHLAAAAVEAPQPHQGGAAAHLAAAAVEAPQPHQGGAAAHPAAAAVETHPAAPPPGAAAAAVETPQPPQPPMPPQGSAAPPQGGAAAQGGSTAAAAAAKTPPQPPQEQPPQEQQQQQQQPELPAAGQQQPADA
ncbi:MAG: N2227-like protein-domain-containing protein [Monoraphidium minutum]|nr:MAG: N2227-like protein-domain-containing protein [Monoraphidium minutum]